MKQYLRFMGNRYVLRSIKRHKTIRLDLFIPITFVILEEKTRSLLSELPQNSPRTYTLIALETY